MLPAVEKSFYYHQEKTWSRLFCTVDTLECCGNGKISSHASHNAFHDASSISIPDLAKNATFIWSAHEDHLLMSSHDKLDRPVSSSILEKEVKKKLYISAKQTAGRGRLAPI